MPAAVPFSHCEDLIRRADYDRYLSALFAPAHARPHLFALYAFNYEVARTAETVTQPAVGQIRLQWWRDTVESFYGGVVREHPVAEALADTVRAHDLPRALFDGLIDARESDLDAEPFGDLAAMENYADATSGNVMRLAARVLGAGDAVDHAAREAGIAYALVGLLRAQPFLASRGRMVIPRGVSERAVAERALEHLQKMPRVSRRHLPALLPAALVRADSRAFTHPGSGTVSPHRRQRIMAWAMMRGRV